jgi:hypothetical protein
LKMMETELVMREGCKKKGFHAGDWLGWGEDISLTTTAIMRAWSR